MERDAAIKACIGACNIKPKPFAGTGRADHVLAAGQRAIAFGTSCLGAPVSGHRRMVSVAC